METQKNHKNQGVQVISRAADILRLLGHKTDGLSLGQIAQQVDLPRSTVQRIVATLAEEGFVSTEKSRGGIRLGSEIQSLAQATASGMKDRLRPVMERISRETGETVDLAILYDNRMLFIDQIVGTQRLRAVSSIGETFPLTTTANGKAALALMEESRALELIAAEIELQESPPKTLDEILYDIAEIQSGALAKDENEHTEGICALGFATKDVKDDIYALSIPVPSTRYERVKDDLSKIFRQCLTGIHR